MGFPELRGGIFFCGSLSLVLGCCYLQLCSTPRWVHLSFHGPDHRPHPGACFTPCQAFLMFALMACGSTLLSTFRYIQVSPRFKSWQQLLQLCCQLKLQACDLIFTLPRLAQMANYALGRKRRWVNWCCSWWSFRNISRWLCSKTQLQQQHQLPKGKHQPAAWKLLSRSLNLA